MLLNQPLNYPQPLAQYTNKPVTYLQGPVTSYVQQPTLQAPFTSYVQQPTTTFAYQPLLRQAIVPTVQIPIQTSTVVNYMYSVFDTCSDHLT